MNQTEIDRCEVIKRTCSLELSQAQAAQKLQLSRRQIKRLCQRYRQNKTKGLISKKRGKPSNRKLSTSIRLKIKKLAQTIYSGFGPTFMSEKLAERNEIKIGKEALRQFLIAEHLWKPKKEKVYAVHQRRERRPCFGELVQIDGSPHDWFEGRGPKCCLIVFIDDATSKVLYLHFEPVETTQAYFRGLFAVIQEYGIPLSLYSDRHGIFRVNQGTDPEAQTQFGRACESLGIELINAHSAQAKGRVERSNQTQQDRLIKELRLANISDIKSANQFLAQKYRAAHNKKFAKMPRHPESVFIANTLSEATLQHILSEQASRKVTKNLELSFENKIYQIQNVQKGRRLQQAHIMVCRSMSDEIILLHQSKTLDYKVFEPNQKRPLMADEKSLNALCDKKLKQRKIVKPDRSHPWRQTPISKKSALIQEQMFSPHRVGIGALPQTPGYL